MSLNFLKWWTLHAPKGAANSVLALTIVKTLHVTPKAMSRKELSASMQGLPEETARGILRVLEADGLLLSETRHTEDGKRHRYLVYTLSSHLISALATPCPLSPTLS